MDTTKNVSSPLKAKISPNKEHMEDADWEEVVSEGEEKNQNNEKTKAVKKQPKKEIFRDNRGEIVISKLDAYVEPQKTVKEVRGGEQISNKYDFGDLSFSDEEEPKQENVIEENEEESDEDAEKTKSKKKKPAKKNKEDLDDLLAEFGIETVAQEAKPKKVKAIKIKKVETVDAAAGENKEATENKPEEESKKKKKTTDKTTGSKKASTHMNDVKRELLERKEALKKRQQKGKI